MNESIVQQLNEQTLMLQEILRRLSMFESAQVAAAVHNTPAPAPCNSLALTHLRSLGEVF